MKRYLWENVQAFPLVIYGITDTSCRFQIEVCKITGLYLCMCGDGKNAIQFF